MCARHRCRRGYRSFLENVCILLHDCKPVNVIKHANVPLSAFSAVSFRSALRVDTADGILTDRAGRAQLHKLRHSGNFSGFKRRKQTSGVGRSLSHVSQFPLGEKNDSYRGVILLNTCTLRTIK